MTVLLMGLLVTQYTNCSSYSDNNLFGASSTATTQTSNTLSLSSPRTGAVTVLATEDKIVLGGDCYASTYPKNYIEYKLVNVSTQVPQSLPDFSCGGVACTLAKGSRCEQDHYSIVVPVGASVPASLNGTAYEVRAQLVVVDAHGAETRDSLSQFKTSVVIYGRTP